MRDHPYDAIVIGAGQAGGPLAGALAKAGRRVALVEREHVGGSCINEGCSPTKTMIASARVAHLARRAADYGVRTGEVRVDLERVRERKRAIVTSFREGSERSLAKIDGVDLVRGHARFLAPDRVRVEREEGGLELTAERVFINVGTRTSAPPIDGLDEVPYLTNATIMELAEVPEHLVVLGGGTIGLEFAQMFRRFGARVTVVEALDTFLPQEDRDVAEALLEILREDGIEVLLGRKAARAGRDDDGVVLRLDAPDGEALRGSHLLVATGRRPNTDDLGLDAAGVETDERGYVRVDERLRTSAPNVWALGDVTGGPAFTHVSYDDYRIVRDHLLHGADRTTEDRIVAYTVFTDPQLGRVGLTETQARERGHDVRVATLPMTSVARAIETDETRGLMKAVVDAESGQILGAAVLGIEGGEVVGALQVAMRTCARWEVLRDLPFSHPTLSESLNNLFMKLD